MLSLFRALTTLRRAEPSLYAGSYASVDSGQPDVFAYLRTASGGNRFLVVLNFSGQEYTLNLSKVAANATISVATGLQRQGSVNLDSLQLAGNEGLVLRLK